MGDKEVMNDDRFGLGFDGGCNVVNVDEAENL